MSKIVVVIQARLGSTRLPGKILLDAAGAPMLVRMLERVRAAATPFEIVVATTTAAEDDAVAAICQRDGARVFRGHPTDLLDRHLRAAEALDADVCVKIPSDCPLIDPAAIDQVLGAFLDGPPCDYLGNLHPPSWPDGNDVEVFTMEALRIAHREARRPLEREHTTPFFWERPERFFVRNVQRAGADLSADYRFTVDYRDDYRLVATIFDRLYRPGRRPFGLDEILAFLAAHPEVHAINARYRNVNWYRHHLGELRTVDPSQTRVPQEESA